jgi:hypothetical protein
MEKAGHAGATVGAAGQLFGDRIEVIGRRFDSGIALDHLENVEQIGADVVQLDLGTFARPDAIERALDEAERLLKSVVKGAGHRRHVRGCFGISETGDLQLARGREKARSVFGRG